MKISEIVNILNQMDDDDICLDELQKAIEDELTENNSLVFEEVVKSIFKVLFRNYQSNTWEVKINGFKAVIKFKKAPKDIQRFYEIIINETKVSFENKEEMKLMGAMKITPSFDNYKLTIIVENK